MRKLALSSIFLLTVAVIFISCQREVDGNLPNDIVENDTVYIKKYVEIDTTLPTGFDTTLVRDFQYDVSKRISKIVERTKDWVHSTSGLEEFTYYYTGSGSNPSMIRDYYFEIVPYILDTIWFNYDAGGFVVRDSIVRHDLTPAPYFRSATSTSYTNSGTNTFVQIRDYSFATIPPVLELYQGTVFKTYSAGNISTQTDTCGPLNQVVNVGVYQITCDARKNPFYKTDIHYPVFSGYNISGDQQKNNFTEIKRSGSPGVIWHIKYSYTYRNDGYPLVVKITDLVNPGLSRKGFYFY